MKTIGKIFVCVFLASVVSGKIEVAVDVDDTIVVEAEDPETQKHVSKISAVHTENRVKRQLQPGNSIFAGFPGWGSNGFGMGGFHLPGFDTGNIHNSIHNTFPGLKPGKPNDLSCYTANGETGKCAQFRQCYGLLFPTEEDEERNEGLAITLRDSAGSCYSSPAEHFSTWYSLGGVAETRQKNDICCASGPQKPGFGKPKPTVPTTTKAPVTQRTTKWPGWPPQVGGQRPPTAATTPAPPAASNPESYNCAGFYIIGGSNVAGRPYPWMASIKDGRSNRHVCGGSLISPRSVLSAAHCVKALGPQQVANMRVYLGANDITHPGRCTVVKKVRNIKYHRGFSMNTLHHDIAILTLDSAVPLGGNIQTVSLGATRVAAGSKATVAGWGGVHFGGQTVSQLRHVTLDVISNPVCAAKYVGSAPAGITQHQMCAGSPGKDSCVGDSGGPLMMGNQQVGVVSFGVNCGTQPGVYTRIASYLSWINKNKS